MNQVEIKKKLKALKKREKLSFEAIARICNSSYRSIINWLVEDKDMSDDKEILITKYLKAYTKKRGKRGVSKTRS